MIYNSIAEDDFFSKLALVVGCYPAGFSMLNRNLFEIENSILWMHLIKYWVER